MRAAAHAQPPVPLPPQELQSAAALQARGFVSLSVEFSEDVSTSVKVSGRSRACATARRRGRRGQRQQPATPGPGSAAAPPAAAQSNKGSASIVSAWNGTKASTEQTMKLLQGYKDVGDSNKEVSRRHSSSSSGGACCGSPGRPGLAGRRRHGTQAAALQPQSCPHAGRGRCTGPGACSAPSGVPAKPCPSPPRPAPARPPHPLPRPQPYLKFHNPRTFEDMDKPIPNFKKFGLKAGEVPKFFDGVLTKRAGARARCRRCRGRCLRAGRGPWPRAACQPAELAAAPQPACCLLPAAHPAPALPPGRT